MVNHAAPFHTGGSEKVVQQITESMHHDYGMSCHVVSKFAKGKTIHNGVHVEQTKDTDLAFLGQIKSLRPDHLHVYSDSMVYWPTIVRHAEEIPGKKSIALVGMNYMRGHPELLRTFKAKSKEFTAITHSDNYLDYSACKAAGIDVKVIPNAIDISEFQDQGFSFRQKHNIKTEKMILCVSNFFPGKGQEHLDHCLRNLSKVRSDFTAVFISSTVNFQMANIARRRFSLVKKPYPTVMLSDIPRSETIQAFKEADVFAFPSQVEVAPLVILEAMSVGLPWVSLNVGNVSGLDGGFVVNGSEKTQGKWKYTKEMYEQFADRLNQILSDRDFRIVIGNRGRNLIESDFNWQSIKKKYHDVFVGENT